MSLLAVPLALALTGAACGVAFSPGTSAPKPPVAFQDEAPPPPAESEAAVEKPVPTVGVSLVVNGRAIDAGTLPPPPVPIVAPP